MWSPAEAPRVVVERHTDIIITSNPSKNAALRAPTEPLLCRSMIPEFTGLYNDFRGLQPWAPDKSTDRGKELLPRYSNGRLR
jgi:hypothetical protein